jgi:hypothetical protein
MKWPTVLLAKIIRTFHTSFKGLRHRTEQRTEEMTLAVHTPELLAEVRADH